MRFPFAIAALALLASCRGPTTLPEQYLRDLPADRPIAPEVAERARNQAEAALAAVDAGRFEEGRSLAEDALASNPRLAIARVAIARCLIKDAQREVPPTLALWRHAEGELLIAQRLAPERPEVHLARAEFFAVEGHLSAAAESLEQGLSRAPNDVRLVREGARLRYELGEERAAGALLVRWLAEVPTDTKALWMLAQVRAKLAASRDRDKAPERQKAYREAADSFHRYAELVPTDGEGWLGEAWARSALGGREAETAVKLYELAEGLIERSPEPSFGKAVTLEALGRAPEAREAYRRALGRDDRHVGSLLNLAASLGKGDAKEKSEAKVLCRRLLDLRITAAERQRIEKFLATPP